MVPSITSNLEKGVLDPRRVAVLPLTNMSPDPNDKYFADGMTEELISTISRIGELSVISRTSVMKFKDTALSIGQVAQELGGVAPRRQHPQVREQGEGNGPADTGGER